jgi:glycosyltransferase involved in cell wall biosynthesis
VKVLYLSRGYSPHDHRFLSAISSKAERTFFSRLEQDLVSENRPLPDGVEEIDWTSGGRLQPQEIVRALDENIHRLNPDLVHAGPIPSVAFTAARTGYSPLISMSWGSDILIQAQSEPALSAARYALEHSALAFADCHAVKEELAALGMRLEDIVVFPWGVDLQHFSPRPDTQIRADLGWQDERVILSTRSLEPHYGAETVLDGFIQAAIQDPTLRLLQLGQGSLRERLQKKLAEAGMQARAHFAGQVGYDLLPNYYRSADLYLTASRADGSSISLLEAMASGLPALVTDIPGNREWVTEGDTGWFFPVGDAERLATGIASAFSSAGGLESMGQHARQVAETRADWQKSIETMMAGYQRVLDKEFQTNGT